MRIHSGTANLRNFDGNKCNGFDEFESKANFSGNGVEFNWRKHVRWHKKIADFSSNVRNGTIPDETMAR